MSVKDTKSSKSNYSVSKEFGEIFSHQSEPKLLCVVKSDFLSCCLTKLQGDVKFMAPNFLNSFHIQADL